MKAFIRVSKLKPQDTPFAKQTYYKWFHQKRHLQLFSRVGNTLFLDLSALERLIEAGRPRVKEV